MQSLALRLRHATGIHRNERHARLGTQFFNRLEGVFARLNLVPKGDGHRAATPDDQWQHPAQILIEMRRLDDDEDSFVLGQFGERPLRGLRIRGEQDARRIDEVGAVSLIRLNAHGRTAKVRRVGSAAGQARDERRLSDTLVTDDEYGLFGGGDGCCGHVVLSFVCSRTDALVRLQIARTRASKTRDSTGC